VLANLDIKSEMRLVLWRDGRYQELALQAPQRYFGATFDDYKPRQTNPTPQ
jgi:hypothetical protein